MDLLLPKVLSSKKSIETRLFVFSIEWLSFFSFLESLLSFFVKLNARNGFFSSSDFLSFTVPLSTFLVDLFFLRRKSIVFLNLLFSMLLWDSLMMLFRGYETLINWSSFPCGLVNRACSSSRASSMLFWLFCSYSDYSFDISPQAGFFSILLRLNDTVGDSAIFIWFSQS